MHIEEHVVLPNSVKKFMHSLFAFTESFTRPQTTLHINVKRRLSMQIRHLLRR